MAWKERAAGKKAGASLIKYYGLRFIREGVL